MSAWQAVELLGVFVAGFGTGLVAVYLYARHVFRQKLGVFLNVTTSTSSTADLEDGFQ